jgi:hypothetical protein
MLTVLLTSTYIVGSVAVNLYQTSCEAFGAQAEAFPSSDAPLKLPETVEHVRFGVSVVALAHKSFCAKVNSD